MQTKNRTRESMGARAVQLALLVVAACGSSTNGNNGDVDASPVDTSSDAPCGPGTCPSVTDPAMPGSSSTSIVTYDLELADVTIPLTIYLPAGTGPFPVVVFHHGFQLDAAQYATSGTHLASWGYIVVMPQMPGGLIGGPTHKELAVYVVQMLDWITTTGAMPGGPLGGAADVTRIGLAGHSMGGKISMLTATQDARVDAVFGIDPVDAAGSPLPVSEEDYPSVTPELMGQIAVPIAVVGETINATCTGLLCQACAPEEDNFHQYYENAAKPAIEIEIIGANHMSFLDDPACGFTCSQCPAGTDDPELTKLLTRRAMTAFFQIVLRQQPAYLDYLTGQKMADDVAAGRVLTAHKNGL